MKICEKVSYWSAILVLQQCKNNTFNTIHAFSCNFNHGFFLNNDFSSIRQGSDGLCLLVCICCVETISPALTFKLDPRQRIQSVVFPASIAPCQFKGHSRHPFSPKCTIVSLNFCPQWWQHLPVP